MNVHWPRKLFLFLLTALFLCGGTNAWAIDTFGVRSDDVALPSTSFSDTTGNHTIDNPGFLTSHQDFGKDTSIFFDASAGAYLSVTDNDVDFDLGTGNFTIDMWVNLSSTNVGGAPRGLLSTQPLSGTANGYRFDLVNGELRWFSRSPSAIQINTGVFPDPGTWYHLAAVRDGDTLTIYVNGEVAGTPKTGIAGYDFNTANGLVIGKIVSGVDNYFFDGYMDEVRVNKGEALTFTPETLPNNPRQEVFDFTLLQTSDLHHHASGYGPFLDYESNFANVTGGYARLATLIKGVKTEVGEDATLLVDSGDFLMGTPYDLATNNDISLKFFMEMGYDAITLGNHEFDWTPDGLALILSNSITNLSFNVPVVASNMEFDPADAGDDSLKGIWDAGYIKDYEIITVSGGLRVGILGLLGPGAQRDAPLSPPLTFNDGPDGAGNYAWDYAAIQNAVDAINANVDILVVLSHSGVNGTGTAGDDIDLADNVTGIDIIASGHAHTDTQTIIQEGDTYIFSPGEYGEYLSRMDITFNVATDAITSFTFDLLDVDNTVAKDGVNPEEFGFEDIIDTWNTGLNAALSPLLSLSAPISHTAFPLDQTELSPFGINNLGSLCADAVRATATNYGVEDCRVAVVAKGVIRDDILVTQTEITGPDGETLTQGAIPFSDIYTVLPLGISPNPDEGDPDGPPYNSGMPGYPLYEMDLRPFEVLLLAELGMTGSQLEGYGSFYLNFSGLQIEYNPATAPAFAGVQSVKLYDAADTFCQGTAGGFPAPVELNPDPMDFNPANSVHCAVDIYALQLIDVANGLLASKLGPSPFPSGVWIDPQFEAAIVDGDSKDIPEWKALMEFLGTNFPFNDQDPSDPKTVTIDETIYGDTGSIVNRIKLVPTNLWVRSDDVTLPSTAFDDNTGNHEVENPGELALHEAFGKDTAIAFNATAGAYLSVPGSSNWDMGTGNFTIDMWVNLSSTNVGGAPRGLLSTQPLSGTANGYRFDLVNGELRWFSRSPSAIQINTGVFPDPGTWYHLAAVRDGDTLTIYVNGEVAGTPKTGIAGYDFNTANGLVIGKIVSGLDDYYFDGYMDEVRVIKGDALVPDPNALPNEPYLDFAAYIDNNPQNNQFDSDTETGYPTIQEAITDAALGETIRVFAGNYSENIVIGTPLSLIGEDKETTIINGGGSGIVVTVAANNVTLSGFTVTNSGDDPQANAGIVLTNVTGCTINNNIVKDNLSAGIGLIAGGNNTLSDNTVTDNVVAGIALIASSGNTIQGNTCSNTQIGGSNDAFGLALEYNETYGGGCTGNIIDTGNTFSNNAQDGIYLAALCNGNTIDGNTITDNLNNGIYVESQIATGDGSSDNTNIITNNTILRNAAYGIWFHFSNNTTNTSGNTISENNIGIGLRSSSDNFISGNTITNNTTAGIKVSCNNGKSVASKRNTITTNTIEGNSVGVDASDNNGTDDQYPDVNATANWWGDTVPSDDVTDYVLYDPWYLDVAMSRLSNETIHNTTQDTWYASIQEAVDEADQNDIIEAEAGTYAESFTISTALTLLGPNAGIDPRTNPSIRVPEATIEGIITIGADDVLIDGFELTNPNGPNVLVSSGRNNLTFQYNFVNNVGTGYHGTNRVHCIGISGDTADADGITIQYNEFWDIGVDDLGDGTNSGTAAAIGFTQQSSTYDVTNVLIQENWIHSVDANTTVGEGGPGGGAYGILLGLGATGDGTVTAQILNNKIEFLEGEWSTGIGLEGPTPGTVVKGNIISNLVSAVVFEDNDYADEVTLKFNKFSNCVAGVGSFMNTLVVDATLNWWGDASGPSSLYGSLATGSGVGVGPYIDFEPWIETDNTVLWVRSDDVNLAVQDADITFEDSTGNHQVVNPGDLALHTEFAKDTSMTFDASAGAYLSVTDNDDDFDLGTGNFTIDMWVNLSSTNVGGAPRGLLSTQPLSGTANGYRFDLVNGELRWFSRSPSAIQINTGVFPDPGTWYHLAAVRDGDTLTIYVNGEVAGTPKTGIASYDFNTANGLVIGKIVSGVDNYFFDGYMDEVRVIKGDALVPDPNALPNEPYFGFAAYIDNNPQNNQFDSDTETGYPTIQEAITNAILGETVIVMAGTYTEPLAIGKAMTLQGESQSGVIIAPLAEDPGNISNAIEIQSSNVTIRQLTIDGHANPALPPGVNHFNQGIMTNGHGYGSITVENVSVKNVKRRGVNIWGYNDATTPTSANNTVTGCTFENIRGGVNGVYAVMMPSDGGVASNNTVDDAENGIMLAYYVHTGTQGSISGNTLTNIGQPGTADSSDWTAGAIQFSVPGGNKHKAMISGNSVSDIADSGQVIGYRLVGANNESVISGNTADLTNSMKNIALYLYGCEGATAENNTFTVAGKGQGVFFSVGSSGIPVPNIVTGNTITSVNAVSTQLPEGCGVVTTNDKSLDLGFPYDDHRNVNNTVTDNIINGFVSGILVHRNNGIAGTVDITIKNNELSGNLDYGIRNVGAETVDATNNWWGDVSGPSHAGNPDGIGDAASDDVDYDPWYLDVAMSRLSNETIHNTTQGTWYSSIQVAVDEADPDDIIEAEAGIYAESFTIGTALTLLGPNEGKNPNTETRDDEATIQGSVTIGADTVKIDGFTFTNPDGRNTIVSSGYSNLEITNNIFTDIGNNSLSGATYAIGIWDGGVDASVIDITYNRFSNIYGGEDPDLTGTAAGKANNGSASAVSVGDSESDNDIDNVTIKGNEVSNIYACTSGFSVGGKGAYGFLINVGASSAHFGQANDAEVSYNKISNLEGYWAHAIGLEGDTPRAIVKWNPISDLTDHKEIGVEGPYTIVYPSNLDAVGVMVEDNDSAGTVDIDRNTFSSCEAGVRNNMGTLVDAENNNWGAADGPSDIDGSGGPGSGVGVWTNVDYTPWLNE